MTSLPENLVVILIGRFFHLCIIMLNCVLNSDMAVVLISHSGVNNTISNGLFRVWKISMRIKSRNLPRRMFSWIYPRAVRSRKFKKNSLVASRTCELDRDPQSVLFLHWFHRSLGSSCFASEAYHSRNVLCGWQYWQKSKRAHFVSARIRVEAKMPSANVCTTQEDASGLL